MQRMRELLYLHAHCVAFVCGASYNVLHMFCNAVQRHAMQIAFLYNTNTDIIKTF